MILGFMLETQSISPFYSSFKNKGLFLTETDSFRSYAEIWVWKTS